MFADAFRRDLHEDLKADYALTNPPFNESDWHRSDKDVRWKYGVPPGRTRLQVFGDNLKLLHQGLCKDGWVEQTLDLPLA